MSYKESIKLIFPAIYANFKSIILSQFLKDIRDLFEIILIIIFNIITIITFPIWVWFVYLCIKKNQIDKQVNNKSNCLCKLISKLVTYLDLNKF